MNCGWIFSSEGGGWTSLGQVIRLVLTAIVLIATTEYWPQTLLLHLFCFPIQAILIYRIYMIIRRGSNCRD